MAKIGGPLSPGIPPSRAPGTAGRAEPARPQSQPAPQQPSQAPASQQSPKAPAPQQSPQTPASVSVQAQQVAQQFGSAFASAGRLASQLVKGLGTQPNAQARRPEKPSAERTEEGKGGQQSPEAEHGPEEAEEKNPLATASSAQKQTRLFRFRKTAKKRAGASSASSEVTSNVVLGDDYNEDESDHQRARNWLGEDQEETSFGQAKREALFLQHLERQGEPPSTIARHLGSQFGGSLDPDFKHLLSDQIRPQMDAMAGRVNEVSTDERRALAAFVSRAAYQVGVQSAATFAKLLASAGAAEAAHLTASQGTVSVRVGQLEQALRRAASPMYRAALIEAGRGSLEKLAGEAVKLAPEERHLTWVSLLRSAESLELESLPVMAEAVVSGVLGTRRSDAAETLAVELEPALKLAPGGGRWAAQLILTFAARGEVKAAEKLAGAMGEVLRQARGSCVPVFKNLRDLHVSPSGGAGEEALLRDLEARVPLLAAMLPACSQLFEKRQGIPPGSAAVIDEALLSMASLHLVGATAVGQRQLRQALLAQERGSQTFLSTLPKVVQALTQPQLVRRFGDNGLIPAYYQLGGRPFLNAVAQYTGRALAGPVLARSQKGDVPAAKALLRSAVRSNAALFGLNADGALLAAEVLEALRDKPGAVALRRSLALLEKIREKHSLAHQGGGIEPLQGLATLLAERELGALPQQRPGEAPLPRANLTVLEIAMDQSARARLKAARPAGAATAPEPAPPPGGTPRSRK